MIQSPAAPRTFPARAFATWAVSLLWLAACKGDDLTAPTTGAIVVTTATAGVPPEAGGYTVVVDAGNPRPIGANGAITVTDLIAGPHTVQVAGVSAACTVSGDNPRTVGVTVGASVDVTFAITCPGSPGAITVTTTTTGLVPDPDGYQLQTDGDPAVVAIGTSATLVLPALAPGTHTLQLNGVAPNCTVGGENPRTIEVVAGAPITVDFTVACAIGTLRWTQAASGTTADLPDVWGTGAADVFVVGELDSSGDVASVVVHYDGTSWRRQFRQSDLQLRGVWGSSPADVYAVGFHFFTTGAVVLHYDGTRWTQVQNFVSQFEDFFFFGVWGSSGTDVFAVGSAFDGQFERTFIAHFDGVSWQRMPGPAKSAPGLNDVWGSGPTDVYAIGRDETSAPAKGVILHYDGAEWSPVLREESLLLNGVWSSSATDVFAVGFEIGPQSEVSGAVRHFDGTAWSRMPLPAVGVLHEVWGSSASDVYAVGDDGLLLHYDGTAWTESRPTRRSLLGAWGSSASDVFLVGNGGLILHGTP